MLLRLAGSQVTDRGEYVVIRTPANPTFWWGNFVLFRTGFAPGELAARLDVFRSELPSAERRRDVPAVGRRRRLGATARPDGELRESRSAGGRGVHPEEACC